MRLTQPWGRNGPQPTVWEFWFSLGPDGDTITTDDAIIDRDELFGTTMLGAGYYRAVTTGHVQTRLKQGLANLEAAYDSGWSLHMTLMRHRHEAAPLVPEVADALGGARFPDFSIWDRAHKLRMKALEANVGGNVLAAQVYLIVAAQAVEYNAQLLADYVGRTVGGAETAVKVLKVASKAGEVAEGVLLVVGVGAGVRVVRTAGSKVISQEARYDATERLVARYAKRAGISEAELRSVRYVPQPRGTILGNVKGGHSAGYGEGFR